MTTKKDFKKTLTNPADAILDATSSQTVAVKTKQTGSSRRKSSKKASESRSQHVSILLTPTTADSLKFIAQFEQTSVNDIANRLLDKYVADYRKNGKNARKLDQALKLFQN